MTTFTNETLLFRLCRQVPGISFALQHGTHCRMSTAPRPVVPCARLQLWVPYLSVELLNKWITNAFKRLWAKDSATTVSLILSNFVFFWIWVGHIQQSLLPKSGFATAAESCKEAKLHFDFWIMNTLSPFYLLLCCPFFHDAPDLPPYANLGLRERLTTVAWLSIVLGSLELVFQSPSYVRRTFLSWNWPSELAHQYRITWHRSYHTIVGELHWFDWCRSLVRQGEKVDHYIFVWILLFDEKIRKSTTIWPAFI